MKIETYRNLIDQIAAAVLILDGEGIIQYANQDTLDLFCFNSEEELLGLSFESLISPDQLKHFQSFYRTILQGKNSHESLYSLIDSEGAFKNTILSGALVQNDTGLTGQTIWTLKDITTLNNYEEDPLQRKKLEDIHWLSEQGRNLLSINRGEEILNFAGRELQRKLNDCLVLTLSNVDESTLQLEGIFGLENKLLNKVWKLIGGDLKGRLFPIEKRYKDSYSRRQLALHPGGLENFSRNHVPPMISKQISKLVGVEDIYTIGLEGNKQVVGCFYIFTKHPNVIPNQGLIESFTFLVALALEKAAFAGKLEYSEQQLRLIFESAPDGYFISDLKGNFLDGNLAAEKITGYDRDELLGKNLLDIGLLTKDQISLAGNQLTSTLFEKKTGPTDTTLISKDGSPKQVEISTHPAKFGNKPVVLGIARDISKQKDSESNLKIAHETLTRVLEGIDAHVYVADMNTHEILYMNKRMIEDFGGDFVGRICYQVFRGENKRCVDCSNPQLVSDRGEPGNVYVWDGQNLKNKRWYRNYDRAIYWADQRLVRMQIAFDITDSIQASNALRRSEERYRNLFESSSNAIMTLSPPNWNFTSGNPAMVEMFGLNDENPFLEYQPWQLSPEFQPDGQLSAEKAGDMIRIAVEKGSNFFNWTHKRINGETFPSTVLLTRVDIEENYYLHATVRDISAQVQAEKQLIQKMDDLAVINTLNVSANQGQSLRETLDKLSEETRRIFHCKNTTVYLLSKDESYLSVDIHSLEGSFRGRIEKLININIPDELEVLLREGSAYRKIIFSKQPQILTDPDTIQDLMKDFITSTFLPDPLKKVIRNMIPQIYKLSGIQSMISVPLIASGKLIGLMDMSLPHPFPEEDQERFLTIAEQLSGIIQRVRAEEDRAIKIQELKLINQAIVDGSRIEEIDEICQNLAENIIAVNPKAYVMVSLYDPDQNAIRVRALKGLGKIGDRLSKLLGGKPEDIRIKSADSALDEGLNVLFTSGKLERVPGGLYDLTRGQISRRVCASIERMAGVKDIYIAGFGLRGKSIGGLILFLQGGSQVHYSDAIEAIVSHYAVIFERRIIQQEVLQRKEQLEALRDVELDIVSQLDLKELLYSIAEKATAIVNASAAGFGIYNPDRNVLEYLGYTGFEELPADTDVYPGEGLSGKVWEARKTITVQNYAEWEGKLENWSEMSNYYLAGIPVSWGDEMLG
ncbi:MAG: PAS domain S-box protein, partial [Anaerolineales bacterium]